MPKGDKTKSGKENPTFRDRIGEKYTTNQGYIIEIVEYFNNSNITGKYM